MPSGKYVRTPAHRKAISDGQRLRVNSSSAVKSQICSNLVRTKSDHRWRSADSTKNAEAKKRWWQSLTKAERSAFVATRGRKVKSYLAGLSAADRKARTAAAVRAAASVTRAMWAAMPDEQKAARLAPVRKASQSANPSSIERVVAALLDGIGAVYQRQVVIGRYIVDFYIPSKRIVIECDGSYWHSLPGRPEHDAKRDAYLRSLDLAIVRLPERDIKSGLVANLLSEIAI